jgi:hypothetical protein
VADVALTDRDKRTLRVGGIILGVLLVAFLLFKLLSGGGGEEALPSSSPLRPTTSAPGGGGGTESPSLTPSPVLVLPVRDPFSIPPGFPVTSSGATSSPGSTTSGGSTSTSGGTTTPPTSSTPGQTTSSGPGTGGGPRGGANGASTTIGGHQVTLLDTSSNGVEQATVEVDSTVYHPSAGDTFGPNDEYELQSVSGNCATFLFGDQAFTLCVAQNK